MKNEVRFEEIIRHTLKEEAAKLEATDDSLKKVKERIKLEGCQAQTGSTRLLKQKLSDYLSYVLNSHKPAVVLFCIVLLVSMVFVFSKPARVLAKEGVKKLITMVYVVVKGEDGQYNMVQVPMDLTNDTDYISEPTYLNDEELSMEAGFNTKAPENLIGGFILWETYSCKAKDAPKKIVTVDKNYYRGSDKLFLQIAMDKEMFKSKFGYEDHKVEFKVENITVDYIELYVPDYSIIKENGINKPYYLLKPNEINTYKVMEWEMDSIYYHLTDRGTGISLEELHEITNTLITDIKNVLNGDNE